MEIIGREEEQRLLDNKKPNILLVATICLLWTAIGVNAQTVSYSSRLFAKNNYSMTYCVSKLDNAYSIVVKASGLVFLNHPKMKVRTYDNIVMEFSGEVIGVSAHTSGGEASSSTVAYSQFAVTPSDMEILKSGVSKVWISTAPVAHERTFDADLIGAKLYEFYQELSNKGEDF